MQTTHTTRALMVSITPRDGVVNAQADNTSRGVRSCCTNGNGGYDCRNCNHMRNEAAHFFGIALLLMMMISL